MSIEFLLAKLSEAEKAKAAVIDEAKKDAHGLFKPLFDQFPELESFGWDQYTPYFNDGDPCTFGVNEVNRINGRQEYEDDWDTAVESGWGKDRKEGPLYPAYKAARSLVLSLPDDLLEGLFGDHVEVTVTRTEVTTEECSHD